MAEQPRPDDLAQFRAELASLRAEMRRKRSPRRFLPLALVGLLVALLPLSILAAGPFGDLNAGRDAANADIQAIADAGITKGCNPPEYTAYCPNDLVTREQMASFLARTAGLGNNPPVAHAATAQTAQAAQTATNATNANTVGGYAPSGLARVAFAHAEGVGVTAGGATITTVTTVAPAAGFVRLSATV